MKTKYFPRGTCSSQIDIELEDGIIHSVKFLGGCPGNLTAVSRLVRGMKATEAVELLSGIKCGRKSTSCPDQLSKALSGILEK